MSEQSENAARSIAKRLEHDGWGSIAADVREMGVAATLKQVEAKEEDDIFGEPLEILRAEPEIAALGAALDREMRERNAFHEALLAIAEATEGSAADLASVVYGQLEKLGIPHDSH